VNTYYGNLDLLHKRDAKWFAKAQSMFLPLQQHGRFSTFGAMPGEGKPYGFVAAGEDGALLTVVNPSQAVATVDFRSLRDLGNLIGNLSGPRLLFRDAGFEPEWREMRLTLGPEQMALIGAGKYGTPEYDLGVQADVVIPSAIEPLEATFAPDGDKAITTTVPAPRRGSLRILFRQADEHGIAKRTTGGSPPNGASLGTLLTLTAQQDGRDIPVEINYDKAIWSGLSWAVGQVAAELLTPGAPVTIRCETKEPSAVGLTGAVCLIR
jgi:hypothetical protein